MKTRQTLEKRIEKLAALANDPAAAKGERRNARRAIKKARKALDALGVVEEPKGKHARPWYGIPTGQTYHGEELVIGGAPPIFKAPPGFDRPMPAHGQACPPGCKSCMEIEKWRRDVMRFLEAQEKPAVAELPEARRELPSVHEPKVPPRRPGRPGRRSRRP